ncbi:MAG: Gfo/Idh/MocA family oxidoreductase [Candidatus Kapabacteria bacterium]|nr:Gfo/Idh/MocA family oxidoreductase [Candidatus Kapabacteria bacterium]
MIGIVLVGAGNIAQSIHLPLLSSASGVKIVAICDRQISKARILAEKYAVPYAFRTLEEALDLPGVDAVFVTTSTDAHAAIAMQAIAGGKHVFIERPAARTLQETKDIQALARKNGVQVMVGMNHRFRPDVVSMKNAVDRGEIGNVYYVKAGWVKQRSTDARWLANADMSGGGVLVDLGIAVLDMILHVFDFGRVRSVTASTFHHETKSVEDVVVAMLQFENGAVATIETSWSLVRAEDLYYCNVFGKKGSAYINPYRLVARSGTGIQSTVSPQKKTQMEIYKKSYESELKAFVNAVRGLVPMISTIDEALERMKVVEALYASAEQKKEIVL